MAVVPAPGRTPDVTELRTFLSERLARFKVPKAIHVCDALPRAAGGKLQRARLLEWCRDPGDLDGPSDVDGPVPPETERQRLLVDAWQQCLDVRPIGVTDDFVDLGGDSLRAVELAMDMSERLGVEIPAAALYDNPTIAELDAVVDSFEVGPAGKTGRAGRAPARVGEAAMLAEVAELVATWEGRRLSSDSLLVGRNTMGGRPPLFWGVQGFGELREVAERLGPEQPVWGMRSLYETRSKSPENAVALARAYRVEIERIQPEGAVHLGGYCAGAGIAFEIARQLRAAGRDVTSLSLFEHFQPEGYDGRLAYFFAAESGWHPFRTRDEPWLQHGSGPVSLHPSRKVHVDILSDDGVIAALALELEAAEAAAGVKETGMGRVDPQPRIEVEAMPPRTLVSRARRSMEVRITNHGTAAWPAGTMLYSRWGRPGSGTVFFDGVATLGRVTTGETATMPIEIAAPLAPGPWRLSLQLVHAGDWRSGPVLTVFRAPVLVLPGTAVLAYLRRKLTGSSDWSLAIRRLIGRTT
ncbi:MAG: phosphopantetheine-binding protein, partial [Gemmatimonadota bacterium]|jgi:acyl carrier protein